jgi:F-type H+-transporting ATPase subunit a
MNPLLEIAEVSVGKHFYWQQISSTRTSINGFLVCFRCSFVLSFLGNSNLKSTPDGFQNFTEFVTEFIRDLAKHKLVSMII